MTTRAVGSRLKRSQGYVWGFVDQALSSTTNFVLIVFAGRELGPHGLGIVTIGIAGYFLALGFQRSLLTTPLVSSSAALKVEDRMLAIHRGLTVELIGALGASLALLVVGLVVGGDAGRGFLIVAPWIVPALLQDYWRAVLFQERRAKAAVANDGVRALFMVITASVALFLATDWAVVGCWGAGALAGALYGFFQLGARPTSASAAFSWWRRRLWPFGRWLGLEGATYAVADSAMNFILFGLLGASALGGLRAAQTLFAPLSLILPALALPGLPAIARALRDSPSSGPAFRLATAISAFAAAVASAYTLVMILGGQRLITYVFGTSFADFANLAPPIGAWQLAIGLAAGFGIFLTAQQRGRDIFVIRAAAALASVSFVSLLAWTSGVTGAAWGFALGASVATVLTVVLAVRSHRRAERDDARRWTEKATADA